MCGRYTLIETDRLTERFATINTLDGLKPNYNAAPTQTMPVVVANQDKNELKLMRWGLIPSWAKDLKIGYRMINARSEGIETKPSFRHAYKKQRCLVPASGFYEWQKTTGKKVPFYIQPKGAPLFSFAGLWEYWKQPDGEGLESYTIITTQANEEMKPYHDRMPVILDQKNEDPWLDANNQDPEFLRTLIKQSEKVTLQFQPVSEQVNTVKNNSADLIQPV